MKIAWAFTGAGPVSYTHLDVYKRQSLKRVKSLDSAQNWIKQ